MSVSTLEISSPPAIEVAPKGVPEHFTSGFALVLFYTALVGVFDAYCTKFLYSMTTYARRDFSVEFSEMVGIFKWVYLGSCLAFIPRALADFVGRRLMLWVTLTCLCLALWLIAGAQNLQQYTVLLVLLAIFYKSDIYLLVVSEEAPPRYRGFYSGLVVALGAVGGVILGYMVSRMGTAPDAWRGVARFPVWGVVLALPLFFMIRETHHFRTSRPRDNSDRIRWSMIFAPFRGRFLKPLLLISLLKVLIVSIAMAAIAMTHTEYLRVENGFNVKTIGRVIQLDVAASMAALVFAGCVSDLLGRRWCFAGMGTLYMGALMCFALLPRGSNGILAAFVVQSFASTGMYIILRIASSEYFPNQYRSIGSAWTDLFMTIGAACTAIALQSLTNASTLVESLSVLSGVYLLAMLCVVPAVVLYALLDETRGEHLELVGAGTSADPNQINNH